ncbi:MAG: hypothetical protein ACREXX_18490 [Gammaproteobacteria bacterium]
MNRSIAHTNCFGAFFSTGCLRPGALYGADPERARTLTSGEWMCSSSYT